MTKTLDIFYKLPPLVFWAYTSEQVQANNIYQHKWSFSFKLPLERYHLFNSFALFSCFIANLKLMQKLEEPNFKRSVYVVKCVVLSKKEEKKNVLSYDAWKNTWGV